jgi:hypothetical protein
VQRHVGNQALACAGKVVYGVLEQHEKQPFPARTTIRPLNSVAAGCHQLSSHLWPLL